MAKEHFRHIVHVCTCTPCQQHPYSAVAREHRRINRLIAVADDRTRRHAVGFLAQQHGSKGIALFARNTAKEDGRRRGKDWPTNSVWGSR